MLGLLTQESMKFENFFQLIQNEADKKGAIFFAFAGDGRDFDRPDMEGEDMMGWLIPKPFAMAFQKDWEANNSEVALDSWKDFFTWAEWKENNGIIFVEFNNHAD